LILRRYTFLLDGLGALVSAALTGGILPQWTDWVGLSPEVFRMLAVPPMGFAAYSLACFARNAGRSWLLGIIAANLGYCAVSATVCFVSEEITALGRAVLAGEMLVVGGVVALEVWVYRKSDA